MITFIKQSQKNNVVSPVPKPGIVYNKTLSNEYSPVLSSPFTIERNALIRYLSDTGELGIDFSLLVNILKDIDVKELIKNSLISDTIFSDIEKIRNDYKQFNLESKMKFPYGISLYVHNFTVGIIKNISNIIQELNYCAFVSASKTEIDDTIKKSKSVLQYDLWLSYCNGYDDKYLEETLCVIITPFSITRHFDYLPPNNPFKSEDDYIFCLTSPYKFKLDNLSGIKDIFNTENNKLYELMSRGLPALQREILTYRAKDIINLFLLCMNIIHIVIEYTIIHAKELHEAAFFIYNEIQGHSINESEVFIPGSVHELFRLLKIDDNSDKFLYSKEAVPSNMQSSNMKLENIDETYKRKFDQFQKIYIKIFKIGISKIFSKANSLFFKKHYGRIPHLFNSYGDAALIAENQMVGDPGKILTTVAVKYIEKLSFDSAALFNTLIQMAQRLTSTENVKEKINIIKNYCKKVKIDDDNLDAIKNAILAETRFRIASSILQNNVIYGFTVDGIMQNKKFPPANHIVVSLFIKNPHEKPIMQSVSTIFSNGESLLLFAHPERIAKFNNLYRQNAAKIIDTFNPKIASLTEKNMTKAAQRYSSQLMSGNTPNVNNAEETDPREHKKIVNMIHGSVIRAIDMTIEQKRRCLQCTGIAHDMIGRVTDLAKRCVVALLESEKQATDPAYKSGLKQNKNARVNKQNQANINYIERLEKKERKNSNMY